MQSSIDSTVLLLVDYSQYSTNQSTPGLQKKTTQKTSSIRRYTYGTTHTTTWFADLAEPSRWDGGTNVCESVIAVSFTVSASQDLH